jgi:hypothetical protein
MCCNNWPGRATHCCPGLRGAGASEDSPAAAICDLHSSSSSSSAVSSCKACMPGLPVPVPVSMHVPVHRACCWLWSSVLCGYQYMAGCPLPVMHTRQRADVAGTAVASSYCHRSLEERKFNSFKHCSLRPCLCTLMHPLHCT